MSDDVRQDRPRPDFFIVGSFKAGTSSLYEYLRAHPQIFMPFHKEPLYFGDDLTRRYGRMTQAEYLDLFSAARPGQRIGEASTWYLYSSTAAEEIRRFSPDAQIIVMLRHPVDVMHAQHSQLVFTASEDIADFAEALAAEPARRRGERLPAGPVRVENLFYRDSVRFADQLERYVATFGRERVHVLLQDDLQADTAGTYAAVLRFLGVDDTFRPAFGIANRNKRPRVPVVQRLLYRPPRVALGVVRWLRRFPLAHAVRRALVSANSRHESRSPMPPELRAALVRDLTPEIRRLEQLIDRDLSAWTPAERG